MSRRDLSMTLDDGRDVDIEFTPIEADPDVGSFGTGAEDIKITDFKTGEKIDHELTDDELQRLYNKIDDDESDVDYDYYEDDE